MDVKMNGLDRRTIYVCANCGNDSFRMLTDDDNNVYTKCVSCGYRLHLTTKYTVVDNDE